MPHYMPIFVLIGILTLNNFDAAYTKSMSVLEKTLKSKNYNRNSLTATVIEIMAKCFSRVTDKVIFAGDWADFSALHRFSTSMFSVSVIGMSQTSTFVRHQRLKGVYELNEELVRKLRYPTKLFVVSVPRGSFDDLMSRVKDSIFWNAEATFLFVDEDTDNACDSVTSTLQSAWKFNILQAIYMCRHASGNIIFYNFNPFTDLAPVPWKIVDVVINPRRNHPVTIYQILFDGLNVDSSLCDKLQYDKVKLITGYPMRLCGVTDPVFLEEKRQSKEEHRDLNDFDGIDVRVAQIIWSKLQACPTLKIVKDSGFIENNVPYGLIKNILDSEFDVSVNQYFFRSFWRLQTYPHGVEDLCALSRENHSSQDSAMTLWIFKPRVLSIIVLTSIVTALMIKQQLRISLSEASLTVFSMLLGLSTQLPKTIACRINLSYVMILMFGLNVFLSCSLTSFMVAPNTIFNVDSLADLMNHKYNAIGAAYVKEYIIDENFLDLFSVGHFDECLTKIKAGHTVACIKTCILGIYYKSRHDYLHLSKSSIKSILRTFMTREDWPLRTRFNFLVQKIVESGILQYLKQIETYKFRSKLLMNLCGQKDHTGGCDELHCPVKRETMTFVWYSLTAGILLSSATFFAELLIHRVRRPHLNVKQIPNQNRLKVPSGKHHTRNASVQKRHL